LNKKRSSFTETTHLTELRWRWENYGSAMC
jgi:hypothetical protein